MQTIVRIAAKGFGIALILCAALTKILAGQVQVSQTSAQKSVAATTLAESSLVSVLVKPEVLFLAGVACTAIGFLLKRDRDSIDVKIERNHRDVVEWLSKIDTKVHSTSEEVCALSAACEARRETGTCPAAPRSSVPSP